MLIACSDWRDVIRNVHKEKYDSFDVLLNGAFHVAQQAAHVDYRFTTSLLIILR